MNKIYFDSVIHYLKKLRSEIICIMSGLGHSAIKYYNYLYKVVQKIDLDIKYYSSLEVE